jgi:replicative DNA helicase
VTSKSQAILNALIHNDNFSREVLPYIKPEYFEEKVEKAVYEEIQSYANNYGSIPSPEELNIEVRKRNDLNDHDIEEFKNLNETHLMNRYKMKDEWIKSLAEKFCQDRALYLAISSAIQIYDGGDKNTPRDAIPDLVKDALAISFDNTVGHDYFEDAEKAHDAYNSKEHLIPFKLPIFNKITQGGVPTKSLNIFMGGTNTFKTGFLCDFAASYLHQGYDVLYITLEMSEFKIRERIDANLTHLKISEVRSILKPHYLQKISDIKSHTEGRLFIKEYPMTSANANHFRALLKDLQIKKGFKPKIVIVDYLSICASVRVKDPSNLYSYNKAIAEELRGLSQENDLVIWTGMQTNRSGQDASDLSLENTSESHGVPMTADLIWGIINTEEYESKGLIMIKQLKSRYDDKSKYRRIMLGVDKARMTVFEVDDNIIEGTDLNPEDKLYEGNKKATPKSQINDSPIFDKTKSGGFKFNE